MKFCQTKAFYPDFIYVSFYTKLWCFYQYFLKEKLKYNSDQFTYLSIASSFGFLIGLICFKYYFRKFKLDKLLMRAVVASAVIRLSQLLVVLNIVPEFWLVAVDGITESFLDNWS